MAKVTLNQQSRVVYGGFTSEIKKQLREIVLTQDNRPRSSKELTVSINRHLPVVVTKRAAGKTTGLVHFIGERTLVLPETETIGVLCPTEAIAREFLHQFKTHFPTLQEPLVYPIEDAMLRLSGKRFHEIYMEEVFLMHIDRLSDVCVHFPVVAGVGTIEAPTTVTIRV